MKRTNPFALYDASDRSIKDSKIDTHYQRQVFDVFSFGQQTKEKLARLSINIKKINYLFFIIGFLGVILIVRLIYLQIIQGDYYREVSEHNRLRLQIIKASRGIIYDRKQKPLVKNIPSFNINIVPADLANSYLEKAKLIDEVARITGVNEKELHLKLYKFPSTSNQTYTLLEQVPYQKALQLIVESQVWPGMQISANATREYLAGNSFSNILGYIGKINAQELASEGDEYLMTDLVGKNGIEAYYEAILKGTDGKKQLEVNAQGKESAVLAEEKSIPGKNLVLTLDADLQAYAAQILEKYIQKQHAPGGTVIIEDPKSGQILSLVTAPTYDNNKFITGMSTEEYQQLINNENNPLFNRPVTGTYPPGSTFKPVIAAAALQESVITESTTVNSTGGISINNWFFPDWKSGGHGITDVKKALAESVNTFFYVAGGGTYDTEKNEINGGLGIEKIDQYAEYFGFNQLSGIDLAGEKTGFLPTKAWKENAKQEMWYIGDTYHAAIGQGDILVTPLQIANMTATIANGGTLYQPYLLQKIINENNEVIQEKTPTIIRKGFINNANLQIVRAGMRQAVTAGSAQQMQGISVAVAGKTGTAQIAGTDKTHSWFTCFAPYDNPEIVITVLVEKAGDGTIAALPAAVEILNYYYQHKND